MKKEFKEKIKAHIVSFLYKGLKGKYSCINIGGFKHCPYNNQKPCHGTHTIKVSNKKILDTVTKLFLDKIK